MRLGPVAYAVNAATQEVETRKTEFETSVAKNVTKTPSQ